MQDKKKPLVIPGRTPLYLVDKMPDLGFRREDLLFLALAVAQGPLRLRSLSCTAPPFSSQGI